MSPLDAENLQRPYVPRAGSSAVLLLAALLLVTAAPAAFLLREEAPPMWLTAASFGLVLGTIMLVPPLNRRAPTPSRAQQTVILVAIATAIAVPLALLYPTVAYAGLGWLLGVAVAVQAVLLIAVAVGTMSHRTR